MQQVEEEANRFAADTLIPPKALADFIQKEAVTNESIKAFSEQLGIGPGILVGRLQYEGILEYHEGNAFKQHLGQKLVGES
jgi:Zn-dependent peptidase ImmA (M78 family)